MICVRLAGGLGNQLFQYAAGRALALRYNTDLLLDVSGFAKQKRGVTPRQLALNQFRHVGRIANDSEVKLFSWVDRMPMVSRWVSPWHVYVEKTRGFNEVFSSLSDQTRLVGYWQSFRYFQGIATHLASEFKPVDNMAKDGMLVLDQINAVKSVAVHVRRGDYHSSPTAASFHGVQSLAYYTTAFDAVRARIESPKFFVFSDDPEWCRINLPLADGERVMVDNTDSKAWQDLVLMSYCQHHIIANSSFSWWGAWLADQRCTRDERIVIAPARWLAGCSEQNLIDRFPSHWLPQL